jgi:putative FmdB family regulatory protein
MPLYDYQCLSCGHIVEVMHGVNDPGPQRCERCGGEMRKLISAAAIVFKGSGWAKKDARSVSDARSARPAGAAKSATESDSDSKPAATDSKADKPTTETSAGGADPAA